MSITFDIDDATVILPETQAVLVPSDKARDAIKRDRAIRRHYLFPLFDCAASFACSLMVVPQGCGSFELPQDPWLISVGDDMHFAWGPQAFPAESLNDAIKSAGQVVLISSGPEPYAYRYAATIAAKHRLNVLIIETRPNQSIAWRTHIQEVRGADELPIFHCLTPQETA